jgi:hypothetical protein
VLSPNVLESHPSQSRRLARLQVDRGLRCNATFILAFLFPNISRLSPAKFSLFSVAEGVGYPCQMSETIKNRAGFELNQVESSPNESKVFDASISNVPDEFKGTDADAHDMIVMGKKQVLRRNFGFFTMLGFASTCVASWEGVLAFVLHSFRIYKRSHMQVHGFLVNEWRHRSAFLGCHSLHSRSNSDICKYCGIGVYVGDW